MSEILESTSLIRRLGGSNFSQKLLASILLGAGLLFLGFDSVSAACVTWSPEYTNAGCVAPQGQKSAKQIAEENCGAGQKGTATCKPEASCTQTGTLCCQWKCDAVVTGSDDCLGACVPADQCDGEYAKKASDPFANGTCANQTYVCCAAAIVTPQGQIPGSTTTDAAAGGAGSSANSVDTQVGSDCREPTTGLNFPCIKDGDPKQVIASVVARVIDWILTFTGVLFLIMFIWGGVSYMIAGGDSGRADKARKVLVNAFFGIVIILGSYVILDYIFSSFISALG